MIISTIPLTKEFTDMILATDAIQLEAVQTSTAHAINTVQRLCHDLAAEAGWWDGVAGPVVPIPQINTKLLLIVTEIAEATEGVRRDLQDDKLPHRKMVEVELADALIRILDLAGAMGLDLGGAVVEKLVFNVTRADHKPDARSAEKGKKF